VFLVLGHPGSGPAGKFLFLCVDSLLISEQLEISLFLQVHVFSAREVYLAKAQAVAESHISCRVQMKIK
jgi:hypothetical protein